MIEYWHWIFFGLLLVTLEVIFPGAFFLWVGITAFVLGLLCYVFPFTAVSIQLVLFGLLALLTVMIGPKFMRKISRDDHPSLLNRRAQQLVGEILTLDVPIVNGQAHVTVGDSKWRVRGPDVPAGSLVNVVDVEGNVLIVRKIED